MKRDEESIFAEALARPAGPQRSAFLDDACGEDAALRARVEVLLAAHEKAGTFLESPPSGIDASEGAGSPVSNTYSSETPGATVGPYQLHEQLGEGGMGVVYRAQQLRPVQREVALKIIKPGMDTREVIARFEAERQALAIMDHPSIAKVLDAGATDAGRPYFVMELVRGIPITDYCDQHHLPPRQRLDLFVQVCHAVQHAHQKGIIHRDIKPTNVLVTVIDRKPVPKVIDFGIAKAITGQRLTERTLLTEFRQLIGTPLYMSPEQAELGAAADVDTRSDVYSLGVLLYELLTGTTPFDSHRLGKAAYDEVRRIIREEEPPRPSTRLSTLPDQTLTAVSAQRRMDPKKLGQLVRGELDWIVMKALEKDRARRYESASGLAQDVVRYLEQEPVLAHPPSRLYGLRKFARRHRGALSAAAVVLLVLATATVVSTWQAIRATQAQRQAAQERDTAVVERQRADRNAHTAHNVSSYLHGLIAGANFGSDPQPPADTIRQMLDQFAARFESELSDDPAAKASLHNIVGEAYHNLGDLEKADKHLWRSVELQRSARGEADSMHAALLLRHAGILRHISQRGTNRWADAEAEARRAMTIYGELGVNEGVLNCLWMLGLITREQGRHDEADAFRREYIALGRKTPGFPIDQELGMHERSQGNFVLAEGHFRRWLDAELKHPDGGASPWAYWAIADAVQKQQRFGEALEAYRQAMMIFRRIRPPDHPGSIGATLSFMSGVLRRTRQSQALPHLFPTVEKLAEVEAVYRESHTGRPANVKHHPATEAAGGLLLLVQVCADLHDHYLANGEPQKAAPFRQKALELLRAVSAKLPDDPRPLAELYAELIDAQLRLGLREDARQTANRMLSPPFDDVKVLNQIAWKLATDPDPARRDVGLAVALADRAAQLRPDDSNLRNTLGVALYRAGQYDRAVAELERSIAIGGGDACDFYVLAMAHHQLGQRDPAQRRYDQAVQWTRQQSQENPELRAFQAEAEQLLSKRPATRDLTPRSDTPDASPAN